MAKRMIGFVAAGIWFGVVAAAAPASADGLARFEESIKPQIPPGALTYKSAKGLGASGFELDDAVITPPPSDDKQKPEPIHVKAITVETLDFDSLDKQQPPLFAKIKFDGVTTAANAGGFNLKEMAGIDSVAADFGVDYKLDPDKKTFTLKRLELNLNGLAKLQTSFVIEGVSAADAANPGAAMNEASLKNADLTYDDHSLLSKMLPVAAAAMQGADPKTMVAMAIAFLDGMREGQGAAAQKAIDSLVAFCEDYAKPKGPLKVTLNPPAKVSSQQLSDAKSADQLVKLLGIEVNYPGTRSSKPGETAAAAGSSAKDVPAKDEDDEDAKTLHKKKD